MVLKLQQRRETSDTVANFSGLDSPPYAITLIEEYTSINEQLMIEQPADECIELPIEEFGDESFAIAEDPIPVSRINNPVDVDVDDHIPANATNCPLDTFDISSIVAVLQQEQQYEPSETNISKSGLRVQPTTITLISKTRSPNMPTFNGAVVMSSLNPYSDQQIVQSVIVTTSHYRVCTERHLGHHIVSNWKQQCRHQDLTDEYGRQFKAIFINGFLNTAITTTGPSMLVYIPVDLNSEVTLGLYSKFHGRNGSNNLLSEAYTIRRTMPRDPMFKQIQDSSRRWRLMTASKKVRQLPILSHPQYDREPVAIQVRCVRTAIHSAQPFTDLPFDQEDNITVDQRSEIVFGQNTNILVSAKNCLIGEGVGGGGTGVSESNLWAGVTCHTKIKGPAVVVARHVVASWSSRNNPDDQDGQKIIQHPLSNHCIREHFKQ
ncbi:hypothetical protein BJ742DRAFT_913975 [Cladochytrium replicatum]|nr:hypothetical protein BJ742DRAFT_913975 [Cladochytrium replicatum]